MRTAMDVVCGVILHGDNLGARLLASFGIDLPEPSAPPLTDELAPDAVDLLEAAAGVAAELGDPAVGPEHVVIASAEGADPVHERTWRALGITGPLLRAQLERLRQGGELLAPVPDPAYLAELESALHALADDARAAAPRLPRPAAIDLAD